MLYSYIGYSQDTIETDPELIQNSIDYHLEEAETALTENNYYDALQNLDAALGYAEKADLKKSIAIIYAFKGKLELSLGKPNTAILSLNKSISIQSEIKDQINLAKSFNTLGLVYIDKKFYHKALENFVLSKTLFEEEEEVKKVAETLLLEGKTLILLEHYDQGKQPLEDALTLAEENNFLEVQSDALINIGVIHHKLGHPIKALTIATKGLKIARANNFVNKRNKGYLTLSNITNTLKSYRQSREYLKKHLELSDSIRGLKQDNNTQIDHGINNSFLEVKEELTKTNEKLKQKEIENDRKTLISLLAFALVTILSLLTFLLYKNNNIRLKTNIMLHKKNKELQIAKEKAELASKTKANFLSTVTHELRTPLYAVTGLSNMLLEENPKPEQIQHLKSLKFSGDHLLNFINDILQINKIEANKIELDPQKFDLHRKVRDIISALKAPAEENNIKIHFEYDKNLPETFIGDQLKLSQILINLIGNAIKFTKNGNIWIRISQVKAIDKIYTIGFEIEDDGIGISKEKQSNMFESFSQGSVQINRKYGGTGLGLYIVKGLIDALKGKIQLTSELGKGSTFYFEIPVEVTAKIETQEASILKTPKNEPNLENVKILVVEDNKINQMITKKILAKMELQCDIVDNGEDAVKLVEMNNYDIVLMDIHMPGISGIEATKKIRANDKNLTIFALTAVTIEDKMQEFEDAGFTDIIPKPFKQENFQKKLYRALYSKNTANL